MVSRNLPSSENIHSGKFYDGFSKNYFGFYEVHYGFFFFNRAECRNVISLEGLPTTVHKLRCLRGEDQQQQEPEHARPASRKSVRLQTLE